MSLLKPDIQLFAASPAGEEDDPKKEKQPGSTVNPEGTSTEEDNPSVSDDGLPKTQEELDALIAKRLKREQKKWAKQQPAPPAQNQAPAAPAGARPAAGTVTPPQQTAAPEDRTELLKAQRDLVETRAELEAFKNGVRPEAVEDAVLLAIHEVEKDGDDPDDENVAEALKTVLKRHPEWKTGKDDAGSGFRVGAGADQQQQANSDMLNEIFGLTT